MSISTNSTPWDKVGSSVVNADDDPYGGVIPLTYIGVPFLGFGGVLAFGYNHLPAGTVAIGDAATIVVTGLITYLLVFLANKRMMGRATATITALLTWLTKHIGDDLTNVVVAQNVASREADGWGAPRLGRIIASWQDLYHSCDHALLDAVMSIAARDDDFSVVYAISGARHRSTTRGWTTNLDVCDVTNDALSAVVADDQVSGASFRDKVRKELNRVA